MQTQWNVTPTQAIAIQKQLQTQVNIQKLNKPIALLGGADISFNKYDPIVYAGIIVLTYPALKPVAYSLVKTEATFPYIPGLLSFREIPALQMAWEQLSTKPNAPKPDVLILDGQGIAHPRRLGIATHFGLVTNIPTIGCAKNPLITPQKLPNNLAGSISELYHQNEKVGLILRTKDNTKPVFISPGNLTDFEDTLTIIQSCVKKHRIPEPTRLAHILVNKFRKNELAEGVHTLSDNNQLSLSL